MIDPLTLDQMRVLVAVAETGSFSAAARRLGRVQSAISQAVQAMEATLGVPLFDRSTKTPTLTDAGAAIVADARAIVDQRQRAARARAEHRRGRRGRTDAGGRRDVPDAAADGEPRRRCAAPSPACRRPCSPRRSAAPRKRCAAARRAWRSIPCAAGPTPDISAEFLTRIALVPVVAADHPLAREPEPIAARGAGAACPARADRPHRLRPEPARRHRQPPCLALRRSDDAAANSCSRASAGATCPGTWSRPMSPPDG